MSDWRLLYGPLDGTGTILGELPSIAMSYGEALNGAGRWSATIPLDANPPRLVLPTVGGGASTDIDTSSLDLVSPETLAVARTQVWFERDGVLLNAGILWTAKADIGGGTLELAGEGMHSYFRKRLIRSDRTYSSEDQLDIARDLVDQAQAALNTDVGVVTDTGSSGVLRDRSWLGRERKWVGEALEQLAAVEGGFDWRYAADWVGGVPTVTLRLSYPATGRRTAHVFEVGTNCSLLSYDEDGTTVANLVDAFGAGEGDDGLIATAANAALQGPYRILEDVVTFSDVRDDGTLTTHAQRRLTRGAGPIRHVELETFADTEPALGAYVVGDQVTVRCDYGWVQLDDWFRVVEMTVSVSGGEERIKLALAGLEVFQPV